MSPLTDGNSYWVETTPSTEYAPLHGEVAVDVCVVGGGMTGLLTAWELVEAGLSVIVLERSTIASSVSGYTTAKLTSQHGLKYSHLEEHHSAEAASWYGSANERALARIVELTEQ